MGERRDLVDAVTEVAARLAPALAEAVAKPVLSSRRSGAAAAVRRMTRSQA